MARRPTIFDVAQAAGVSKSTVSLVLQNSPQVRDATREQVQQAMAQLGYVRNSAAAALRGAGPGLIGLVINDLRNPFFTEFAASAQETFARAGYATVVANTDENPAQEARVIASMIEHGVAGLVISPAYGGADDSYAMIDRAGTPTLQVLRRFATRSDDFPFASLDYATGGAAATEHLIAEGCRRIAFVGGLEGAQITQERMAGYQAAMAAAGLETAIWPGRPTRAFGRALAGEILDATPKIDAAICFSDLVALGLMAGAAERGATIGRDLKLVGFDDIEEASLSYPALSSVCCDIDQFGANAAATLLAWLDSGTRPPETKRAPVRLIARGSSTG